MRQLYKVLVMVLMVSGCQSTTSTMLYQPEALLQDQYFPGYQQIAVETEEQVFYLDDEAKAFIDERVFPHHEPERKLKSLVAAIFHHTDMDLLYVNSANTVASETFHNRAANCLSLSIMAYSMAEHAGLEVNFQDVKVPEYWTRRDGYSMLNGHINLVMYPKPSALGSLFFYETKFEVDFAGRSREMDFPEKVIPKKRVLSMFYNNKGADYLVEKDYLSAYAYFKQAAVTDPEFDSVWINLGLLYRMRDHVADAEMSYQQALALNPDSATASENLAYVYQLTNRKDQADSILKRLEQRRQENPYYHYLQGEVAYEHGDWLQAIRHYREAIALHREQHEFYFAMAKTYYQLGDVSQVQSYLQKAKHFAPGHNLEDKYQSKLDMLSRL